MDEAAIEAFDRRFRDVIAEAYEKLQPDVIYCHHLFLLTAIVRSMFPDACVIGQCHGSDLRQFKTSVRLRDTVREGVSALDHIFALHEAQKMEIAELYGVDPDRISVIGSGYNSALFNTDSRRVREAGDPLKLLFAGKISKPKGVPELLGAVRILAQDESVPPFELKLAGGCQDVDVLNTLNDFIEEYEDGCGRCVGAEYLGLIKQTALAEEFKSGDVFVLPSYFEGFGLVLIEAMASGMVPVATRLPGIKEWIDETIPGSNAVFAEMPLMETIDKPLESELPAFTERLADAIRLAFDKCIKGFEQPDTSRAGWDAIAEELLKRAAGV